MSLWTGAGTTGCSGTVRLCRLSGPPRTEIALALHRHGRSSARIGLPVFHMQSGVHTGGCWVWSPGTQGRPLRRRAHRCAGTPLPPPETMKKFPISCICRWQNEPADWLAQCHTCHCTLSRVQTCTPTHQLPAGDMGKQSTQRATGCPQNRSCTLTCTTLWTRRQKAHFPPFLHGTTICSEPCINSRWQARSSVLDSDSRPANLPSSFTFLHGFKILEHVTSSIKCPPCTAATSW